MIRFLISLFKPRQIDFTRGNLWRSVWLIAIPGIISGFLETLYGGIDLAMVGRIPGVGSDAIAGVGQSRSVMFIALATLFASSSVISALVGHYIGAKDQESARNAALQGLSLFSVLGLVFTLVYFFWGTSFLGMIKTSGEALTQGKLYLSMISWSIVLTGVSVVQSSIMRGCGDTVSPLIYSIIANVINIFLNYVFIYGHFGAPVMGVTGAALATVIARFINVVMVAAALAHSKLNLHFHLSSFFYWNLELLKRIGNLSFFTASQTIVRELGRLVFVSIVADLGMSVIAGLNVGIRIEAFCFMPGYAFAIAATTMVAQNLGAARPDRSMKSAQVNCVMSAVTMSILAVFMVLFAKTFARLFTEDPKVIEYACSYLYFMAISEPFLGIIFASSGIFRGAQKPVLGLLADIVGFWGLRVPLCYLAVVVLWAKYQVQWAYQGVWATITLATILQAGFLLLIIYFKRDWIHQPHPELVSKK